MSHLLGQVDAFSRAVAAQKLSRRRDVPLSLIERFVSEDEVAEPIFANSPLVTSEMIDRALASGGSSARAGIAKRTDLTEAQRAALDAPLTPTAPTIWPSIVIGTPPCRGVKSFSATIDVRPLPTTSSKNFVGFLNSAAVRAFPMEMFAPALNVPSIRSTAIRLPPSSTTAITPVVLAFFA